MRRHKRLFSVLVLALCLAGLAFAAKFHSVPLGHRAYDILASAEARGLIPQQTDARPYSCDKVLLLLDALEESGKLSAAELDEVRQIGRELRRVYGVSPSRTSRDVLRNGFFRAVNAEGTAGASAGLQISSVQTLGGKGGFVFDSRNKVKAFVAGDLADTLSFDINFGLLVDKLDYNAFLYNDFRFECEGFYLNPLSKDGPSYLYALPSDKVWIGLAMVPEIDLSFFGGALRMRIGSVRRDWGPGIGNLQLSGSASPFEGIDIQIEPFPWLSLSVVDGSLGKFRLLSVGGRPWHSDDYDSKQKMKYDNNLSAQRVELRPCRNLSLAIFESVVYKKRFELGYLNPLSIYMFT